MDLFAPDPTVNLLPCDGDLHYHGRVLNREEADISFRALWSGVTWKNDEAVIFGKHIVTARKVAWYGDSDYAYKYSGITRQALAWTPEILKLKEVAEKFSGAKFNSCLLNLYHSGNEGMAWHSDDEKELVKDGAIASISLGAERKFCFKHKRTKETVSLMLEHGSLLLMEGVTQTYWLHRLPPTKKIAAPRINLTFRSMLPQ
jgi:alkylated DNA repair dioxygenase AlkB